MLVRHHVEEIPRGTTHVLLLRAGRITAQGSISEVLGAAALSATFGLPLELERHGERWSAWARGAPRAPVGQRLTQTSRRGRERSISSASKRSRTGIHNRPP